MIHVDIVSQAGRMWEGTAESVVVTTETGETGILKNHQPLLALLVAGQVRVTDLDGTKHVFDCGEGFVTVDDNQVIIAVDAAHEVASSAA
ncbi:F-type H+-transporting ATPase subunit epsilon [Actinobaculum suis]|uniref:ATP synthase subunit epsilon n=1 Tax=Actinobaculum suis TaxID=1657 RepID=A0A0K9EQV1_9ACTO|nr:F0F1 ATP synthase subunit epsilon [Actinobaculum suis]KMY22543.1 hypothetical protein ACU19_09485 [Actinobaculum suis]MDY5152998.1 F0F1 ATP synthase subunit epsilon [Actinobaculum suis]OCA94637.1 ATP synthase F1 subunit epsilon [Actinobaculum suis]OCA94949.1 ATP synthase F1 subunit epsilon [Actinobaculum suis]SDE38113.1 F-type H+-transporting ATPase subunit epsilon [Actinobaculum suis]